MTAEEKIKQLQSELAERDALLDKAEQQIESLTKAEEHIETPTFKVGKTTYRMVGKSILLTEDFTDEKTKSVLAKGIILTVEHFRQYPALVALYVKNESSLFKEV